MAYGVHPIDGQPILTKKALRSAIDERGAEQVWLYDISAIDNQGTVTLADLAYRGFWEAEIFGPEVYLVRKWRACVVRKPDGTITIK
jgi:hypothetical protein